MTKQKFNLNKGTDKAVNLIESVTAKIEAIETKSEVLTMAQIKLIVNPLERIEALKQLQAVQSEESLTKTSTAVHNAFLKGADFLAMTIFNNSLNFETTTTKTLFVLSANLKDSNNKVVGMTPNAFSRTFNTSLSTITKNTLSNAKGNDKREIETISYFDNVNQRLHGEIGTTSQSARFQTFFKDHMTDGKINGKIEVYINTNENDKAKVFPFGHYNEILIFGGLELMRTWLLFKGAETSDFSDYVAPTENTK